MSELVLDGTKLAWHKDRVDALLAGERVAPVTIDCALTRKCTYNCVYCIGKLQENEGAPLTRDAVFRFLDDSAEIGVRGISFVSDGESTCSPYLSDAILRGKANGIDMALGTNGYLLDQDRLDEILPALTYLRFNISAGEPERYAEIMGVSVKAYHRVVETIRRCVEIKREKGLDVTIGLQMVLMPQLADQVLPLARLGLELGVDYLVIKHCSDDDQGNLGVEYDKYFALTELLKQAEALSTETYAVRAKWSKIMSGGTRCYSQCYGPPLMMQFSGSGLVAPCGGLFMERFKKYHIGNLADCSFKELWESETYWKVLRELASEPFDARKVCVSLCLQHKVNEALWNIKHEGAKLEAPTGEPPMHVNFI
jgi:MoaA/NifB/PqqE/SkfB family radical SAM enzyme